MTLDQTRQALAQMEQLLRAAGETGFPITFSAGRNLERADALAEAQRALAQMETLRETAYICEGFESCAQCRKEAGDDSCHECGGTRAQHERKAQVLAALTPTTEAK